MAPSLNFHCSWEYLPDEDDTYVTYIIHRLSFLKVAWTVCDHFQGQTCFCRCTCQKLKQVAFCVHIRPNCTYTVRRNMPPSLALLFGRALWPALVPWEGAAGRFRSHNKMFVWMWLYILQSRNSAESVNPGTLCDGGVLRAQHSPQQGRLLFIPVMSILLGISASLHTTCCAQQCGEAGASRVVVSACQSQSQGSVSSQKSDKPYPDVVCLPLPHVLLLTTGCASSIMCCSSFLPVYHKQMTAGAYGNFIWCYAWIHSSHIL